MKEEARSRNVTLSVCADNPDVDRQNPEFLHELQKPLLGAQRNCHDQHVDARDAAEFHQVGHRSKLRVPGNDFRRTGALAVVEETADANVVVGLAFDLVDQVGGDLTATHDHRAPFQSPVPGPLTHKSGRDHAGNEQG